MAKDKKRKSHFNPIWNKIILFIPLVFVASIHKGNPQLRVDLDNDECDFCKGKGLWNALCYKLLRENKNNFKSMSFNVVDISTVGSSSSHVYPNWDYFSNIWYCITVRKYSFELVKHHDFLFC